MRVKVGDRIYDGENVPVMVILDDRDKANIASMDKDDDKYCSCPGRSHPNGWSPGKIKKWMADV